MTYEDPNVLSDKIKFAMQVQDLLGPETRAALYECPVRLLATEIYDQLKRREAQLAQMYGMPVQISPIDPKTDAAIAHAIRTADKTLPPPLVPKISNKSIREQRKALRARRW